MSVYTVHQPPPKADEIASEPERFVFVRDGFSFWAFLLGPLWMLRHRMWLVLLGYAALIAALQGVLYLLNAPSAVRMTVMALVALLIGIEAGTLRRFTLRRRKWSNIGVIVGDRETAEQRFFDSWSKSGPVQASPSSNAMGTAPLRMSRPSNEVIGLFPEPGAQR
jgi:hypothetical protein